MGARLDSGATGSPERGKGESERLLGKNYGETRGHIPMNTGHESSQEKTERKSLEEKKQRLKERDTKGKKGGYHLQTYKL